MVHIVMDSERTKVHTRHDAYRPRPHLQTERWDQIHGDAAEKTAFPMRTKREPEKGEYHGIGLLERGYLCMILTTKLEVRYQLLVLIACSGKRSFSITLDMPHTFLIRHDKWDHRCESHPPTLCSCVAHPLRVAGPEGQ
jgi:hypothetical protein